ncbi:DnaJ C-terminal domain-containing protein [Enterovirga rhinocerotis]|uniref:DnaJ-class molecular chaperone n=1 Tax=Enterovirga rhinocerotis TaxID=1339210 RepID=A0A4R7C6T1_9HYPH|nr:DnaJ C-terminal domain-containing protein [Enterovirga rhinocerotis]TDR94310.1 DnaJ-class molecular chaperone [Enterovirga rhinocerotis]
MRDPYQALNIKRGADEAEIKRAFRKLAKQYHPDRNADDPKAKEKFAEINTAYEILGDQTKRAQFDRGEIDAEGKPKFQGFEGFGGGGRQGFEGFASGFGGAGAGSGADDIFSHLFGDALRGGRGSRTRKGEDISAVLTVTIEDIARERKQRIGLSGGRDVEVTLPAGVGDGQTIRLRGLGGPGQGGGEPGDVLLTVKIAPQERYVVSGQDLKTRVPVDLEDAILGGRVRVETPTGSVEMNIPAMTTSGRTFRLRGKGLPRKDGHGDLLATVEIRLPPQADDALVDYAKSRRAAKVG